MGASIDPESVHVFRLRMFFGGSHLSTLLASGFKIERFRQLVAGERSPLQNTLLRYPQLIKFRAGPAREYRGTR